MMKRFYSQTTGVSYLEGIHRVMPADAREITEARYLEIIGNPVPDKVRSHDADGLPILIDPPPEDLEAQERAWRNCEIQRVQWIRDRHRDEQELSRPTAITPEQFAQLLHYMQALRDWPEQHEFPAEQFRPLQPDWIVEQVE
ncbi:phage tail assembly chaperone [Pseudomonas fluorescens]|uniref:phage tail assembly chaperone n=1 Tax=Pseudomonas fluorescens TaxID=294 RepID=UPI002ACA7D57|nr:phage tail assembly chaperone [Pseudomonas fluorescens]MDZ5433807.1 phage tail assembly chaperone [Pseudomonas fluorescens]